MTLMASLPEYRVATLEDAYLAHYAKSTAMAPHLPRIRRLAEGCEQAVEFGVKRGASTCALLLGAHYVTSVEIAPVKGVEGAIKGLARGRWTFIEGDSRKVDIPQCDLLLIDAEHTYESVRAELETHAAKVQHLLVFHDSITFGSYGAKGESGEHLWTHRPGLSVPTVALGIRPAIDELMMRDPSWRIRAHYTDSHGLLVLERRPL